MQNAYDRARSHDYAGAALSGAMGAAAGYGAYKWAIGDFSLRSHIVKSLGARPSRLIRKNFGSPDAVMGYLGMNKNLAALRKSATAEQYQAAEAAARRMATNISNMARRSIGWLRKFGL